MATNVTVYDLDNYPDNSKTVTIDLKTVIPIGEEGDEKWVLQFYTNAYSDNDDRTAIPDIYVREMNAGWIKSSGLVGIGGKFTIGNTSKTLGVKMDNSTSTYYVELDTGSNLTGISIADNMEDGIREIPDQAGFTDTTYTLSYKNASVEYTNGKFYIVSGSVSPYYSGSDRSSVAVTSSGVDTCIDVLGFNLFVSSENIAGLSPKETLVGSSYTANTSDLVIGAGTGVQVGDSMYITDGTNEDYFTAISGTTDTLVKVCTSSSNSFPGISNNYTVSESKVQRITYSDPDVKPLSYYNDIDSIVRWGIKSVSNQIDFSS